MQEQTEQIFRRNYRELYLTAVVLLRDSDAAKDNSAAIRCLQICRRSSCSEQSIIRTPPYIFQNNIK